MKRYDKDFLHTIALHLDLFNTIGGGVSDTYVKVKKGKENALIDVWAPGIAPETFKIVLRKNKLTVRSEIASPHSPNIKAPLFSRTFMLPAAINLPLIEASYKEGKLQIWLPYHNAADRPREIKIKQI